MTYSVGQRVIVVDAVTPETVEHQKGYYGHVTAVYPPDAIRLQTVYDVQLMGRTGNRECLWFMVTPDDPHPFFDDELEAAD